MGSAKDVSDTFRHTRKFNQPLELWQVDSVTGMPSMFVSIVIAMKTNQSVRPAPELESRGWLIASAV